MNESGDTTITEEDIYNYTHGGCFILSKHLAMETGNWDIHCCYGRGNTHPRHSYLATGKGYLDINGLHLRKEISHRPGIIDLRPISLREWKMVATQNGCVQDSMAEAQERAGELARLLVQKHLRPGAQ